MRADPPGVGACQHLLPQLLDVVGLRDGAVEGYQGWSPVYLGMKPCQGAL